MQTILRPAFPKESSNHDSSPRGPLPSWHRAFDDLAREHGPEPLEIEGRLPEGLTGTLFRSGAARFSRQVRERGHWFDGDGAVSSVHFSAGEARGAVRLVKSEGLLEELRQGEPLHAGFDTPPARWARATFGGWYRAYKNTGAIGVLPFQKRLLALFEGFPPTGIDPLSLETLGETTLGGAIKGFFSAHPRRVPARRATYNFGMRSLHRPLLDLYELPDEGPARRIGELSTPGYTMVHDFAATERYLVFLFSPLRLDVPRMLLQLGTYASNMRFCAEEGTEVVIVPIDDPARPMRFRADPFFCWHFANAWEDRGAIVVDFVHYPDFRNNQWLRGVIRGELSGEIDGSYQRAIIDPRARKLTLERIAYPPCDFPQVSPARWARPSRYAYVAGHSSPRAGRSGPFDRVMRIDTERGEVRSLDLGDDQYPGEPLFAPRQGARAEDEADGFVLAQVYDARSHRSYVAVADGREPERVLARAWFSHHIPIPFHGSWVAS